MLRSISASPVVFHLTSTYQAAQIVGSDSFELKPAEGTVAETAISPGMYYLSTMRVRSSGYTQRNISNSAAIIVLDGTKLGTNLRMVPVDYWGQEGMDPGVRAKADEAEDRFLSKNPRIKALRFVKEIHAMAGEGGHDRQNALELKRQCLLHKVPVFFYSSREALIAGDKRNLVKLDLKQREKPEAPYVRSRERREAEFKNRRMNALRGWIELANVGVRTRDPAGVSQFANERLSESAKQAYKILYYMYNGDAIRSIQADMHNAKSVPYGTIAGTREHLDKMVVLLRKRGETVQQFLKSMYEKWYPR